MLWVKTIARDWHTNENSCNTCHTNGAPSEVDGLEDDLEALALLLEAVGIVHDGHPVPGTYTILEAEGYLYCGRRASWESGGSWGGGLCRADRWVL